MIVWKVKKLFNGFNNSYLLFLAKFPPSNKEHSIVSLLSKHQILFLFLKFHVRYNWIEISSVNIFLLENVFIFEGTFWELPHFFKISRCIWEVIYAAWYTEKRKCLHFMKMSLPIAFSDRRYPTYQQSYQFKYTTLFLYLWYFWANIWELSKFLLYQFTSAWASLIWRFTVLKIVWSESYMKTFYVI